MHLIKNIDFYVKKTQNTSLISIKWDHYYDPTVCSATIAVMGFVDHLENGVLYFSQCAFLLINMKQTPLGQYRDYGFLLNEV